MKKIFNYVLLALITALVLFLALKDNFNETIHKLVTMKLSYLFLAFLMLFLFWLCKVLSMHLLIIKEHKDFKLFKTTLLIMRTQFVNAITPFSTGGQPYQVYYLKKNNIDIGSSTSIIVQNFIVYQIALVFLGIVALFSNYIFGFFPKNHLLTRLIILGFTINTLVIIVLFVVSFAKKINKKIIKLGITVLTKLRIVKNKEKTLKKWDNYINDFHNNATVLLKHKKLFFSTIFYNLCALVFLYSIPIFILYAMGDMNSMNVYEAIIASAYVMLIGSFVPIPGGTGGLEYGFVKFYGFFIHGSILSATMLIWRFITYYFGLIVGAIAMNIKEGS